MTKWINLVETICADPTREDEFNNWYNNVHIPDVLKTPGFIAATRYIIRELRDGRGKYLTIYEIETDDIGATMELRRESRLKEADSGRSHNIAIPNLAIHTWRDVLFEQFGDRR
jgi:hypothetical protein